MSDKIVELFPKKTQLGSGDAFCIQCKHEWITITKIPTVWLECPSCHSMKGLLKFPFHVDEKQLYRECDCGNSLFYLTPEGHLCPNCGEYQTYE